MATVSNALLCILIVFHAIILQHVLIAVLLIFLILDHVLYVLQVVLLAATLQHVLTVIWDSSSMDFNVIVVLLVAQSVHLSQTVLSVFKVTLLTLLTLANHVIHLSQVV